MLLLVINPTIINGKDCFEGDRVEVENTSLALRLISSNKCVEDRGGKDNSRKTLSSMKVDELLELAKELGIEVPSGSKKAEIIALIEAAE